MRTYENDVRPARSLASTFEEAYSILRQDASEYGFIALAGAAPACVAVIILSMAGGPLAGALIVPAVAFAAVLTFTATVEALRRVGASMEPDGARSLETALLRGAAAARPWLPLVLALALAVYALAAYGERLPALLHDALVLAVLAAAVLYALPRSFHAASLMLQRVSARDAEATSGALVRRAQGKVATAWAAVLLPAAAVATFGASQGFGTLTTAATVLAFIGTMPVAATVMSLLFGETLVRAADAQKSRRAPRQAARPTE
jgi:hypothetical protein